jgi:hypothetical protein
MGDSLARRIMLTEMRAAGLAARVVYAAIALPVGGAAGFYACVRSLPKLAPMVGLPSPEANSEALFRLALSVGAGTALTAFLCALTLPWKRRRQRQGRGMRISVTCVLVVAASLIFAGLGHKLIYDLLFAAWLAYLFALTYVRYGVADHGTFDRS